MLDYKWSAKYRFHESDIRAARSKTSARYCALVLLVKRNANASSRERASIGSNGETASEP